MMTQPKKSRVIKVCVSCRSRKIKCDKGEPCSNCTKYNIECVYKAQAKLDLVWISKNNQEANPGEKESLIRRIETLQKEIETMERQEPSLVAASLAIDSIDSKSQITPSPTEDSATPSTTVSIETDKTSGYRNPYCVGFDELYPINFIEKERHLRVNIFDLFTPVKVDGIIRRILIPFSWLSFFSSDKLLYALEKVAYKDLSLDSKLTFLNQIADAGCSEEAEKLFTSKYHDDEDLADLKVYEGPESIETAKEDFSSKIIPIELSTNGVLFDQMELTTGICQLLPEKVVINLFIDRFFTFLYPFMPFVDQLDFLRESSRILADIERGRLLLQDRKDLAKLGILLIMLRLSYVSLFTCNKEYNQSLSATSDETLKILLENPIDLKALDYAQKCLNSIGLNPSADLNKLQLLLMIRTYQIYGPEYILGSGENEPFSFDVVISATAQKLEIFREVENSTMTEKEKNLRRKIGAYIISLSFISFGSTNGNQHFNMQSCNLSLPDYTPENSNNLNEEVEKMAIRVFRGVFYPKTMYTNVRSLFEDYQPMKFEAVVTRLEHTYSSLHTHYEEDERYLYRYCISNTFALRFRIMVCFVRLSIKFHLYSNLEDRELTHKQLSDMLYLIIRGFVPFLKQVFDKSVLFASTIDFIFVPTLLHCIHRALLVLLATSIRLTLILSKMEREGILDEYTTNCRKFLMLLNRITETILNYVLNLSDRYYYAWRTFKTQNYFIRCVYLLQLDSIYKDINLSENFRFSNDWVLEMIGVLNDTFADLRQKV